MIIRFFWGTGGIALNLDMASDNFTVNQFKKWAKLFQRYGASEDQEATKQFFQDKITQLKKSAEPLEAEIAQYKAKADGSCYTELSPKYCRQQAALKEKHLHGIQAALKKQERFYRILEDMIP